MSEPFKLSAVDVEKCRQWMKWIPSKYAGGEHTALMSIEEDCIYRRLLDAMWMTQFPVGTMPQDDRQIATLARVTPPLWRKCKAQILKCFEDGGDGRWHQPDQKKEWEEACVVYAASVNRARVGGNAKSARTARQPPAERVLEPPLSGCLSDAHARVVRQSLSTKTAPPAFGAAGRENISPPIPPPKLITMAEAMSAEPPPVEVADACTT